jgi:hypothetical protein
MLQVIQPDFLQWSRINVVMHLNRKGRRQTCGAWFSRANLESLEILTLVTSPSKSTSLQRHCQLLKVSIEKESYRNTHFTISFVRISNTIILVGGCFCWTGGLMGTAAGPEAGRTFVLNCMPIVTNLAPSGVIAISVIRIGAGSQASTSKPSLFYKVFW